MNLEYGVDEGQVVYEPGSDKILYYSCGEWREISYDLYLDDEDHLEYPSLYEETSDGRHVQII